MRCHRNSDLGKLPTKYAGPVRHIEQDDVVYSFGRPSKHLSLGKSWPGSAGNSHANGGGFLRSDPLLFGVVNVKDIIDVVPQMGRHKLRNVIFHKFLDRVRHLRQPLVAQVIIPFDDFYPRSPFRLSFNPFCNLFVGSTCGDKILEFVCRDFCKTEKEVVERAVKVILTGNPRERCTAFVQGPCGDDIASHGLPRAAREVLRKIRRQILYPSVSKKSELE
jgi:hypothetical protein